MDGGYGLIPARIASGMRPKMNGLYADGSHVIIERDGEAPMNDSQIYHNTYEVFSGCAAEKSSRQPPSLICPPTAPHSKAGRCRHGRRPASANSGNHRRQT